MTLAAWAALGALGLVALSAVGLWIGTRDAAPPPALATDDPTLPAATIAGRRLHLRIVDGPPRANTVIVLHGGPGGDFRSLEALAALSDAHRVVFYDQRGAGLSERVPAEALTLDGYLEELDAVVDHAAATGPVTLIGHSWGAVLAAAYLGWRPERVAAAVLIEPGFLDGDGLDAWRSESRRFMSGTRAVATGLVAGFEAAHIAGPDPQAGDDHLYGRMVKAFADHPDNPYHCVSGYTAPARRFGAVASRTWASAAAPTFDRVAGRASAFSGPVLLMAGSCNSWTGAALQRQHATAFRDARVAVVEDAGHDVLWDNPEHALALIRSFLAE